MSIPLRQISLSSPIPPTMNFAPYQDVDPERVRALSPPSQDGRRSRSPQVRTPPTRSTASPPNLPHPSAFGNEYASAGNNVGHGENGVPFDAFQTSLPLRLDYEAMLAYLLLPPAGPVMLLLLEHKSDYVRYGTLRWLDLTFIYADMICRFHAWQSSMLFTCIFVRPNVPSCKQKLTSSQIIHLLFSWSLVLSWILFAGDLALIAFLALHAYRDGMSCSTGDALLFLTLCTVETLDYYEVPFFGRLANRFVDDE